jgi:hypothetical protein
MPKKILWIRIGFSVDPDPAFYLNADPDLDPEKRANAALQESRSWSNFKDTKR